MKIAILGNAAASFVRPMAEGLQRMLRRSGVESTVFYDGLERLSALPPPFLEYAMANGPAARKVLRRMIKYMIVEVPAIAGFLARLRSYDAIIVVTTIPQAFLTTFFNDVTVRSLFPRTPIVLYDVFYLATRPGWPQWLKQGNADMGIPCPDNWGLERYDWYLCSSVVSEVPMPRGPQPYSEIGLDLDDGSLWPEPKREFTVVLDFECTRYMRERAVQIQALEASNMKYVVLNGHYSISRIRKIYRQASVLLVAMRESFGLPVCEAQACGAYVFTPYSEWCPSHWLKSDLSRPGPGALSPNFIVYDNDPERLTAELHRVRDLYDSQEVVRRFLHYHPQLFRGNQTEVDGFLQKLRTGEIHSARHKPLGNLPRVASTAH